jgi:sulfonate transport system substrate-binding protein
VNRALTGLAVGTIFLLGGFPPVASADSPPARYEIRWAAQEVPEDYLYRGMDFATPFGLKVDTETNPSAARSLQDLLAGRVDVADVGSAPALSAIERDPGNIVIVASTHSGGQRHELLVATGSPYHKLEDLKGHRVAIAIGSGSYIAWEAYLKQRHLTDTDFDIVNMQPPDMANALSQNLVDGAVAWEPTPSILITQNVAREIANFEKQTTDPAVLVTTRSFAQAHPDALARFIASDLRMYQFIHKNPQGAAEVAARVAGESGAKVAPAAFARAFTHMTFDMSVTAADLASLKQVADYMIGIDKLHAVPAFGQIVDQKVLHTAQGLASAGR